MYSMCVCEWDAHRKTSRRVCYVCVYVWKLHWLWIRQHRLRDWGLGSALAGGEGQTQWHSSVLLLCIIAVFWAEHNTLPSFYSIWTSINREKICKMGNDMKMSKAVCARLQFSLLFLSSHESIWKLVHQSGKTESKLALPSQMNRISSTVWSV